MPGIRLEVRDFPNSSTKRRGELKEKTIAAPDKWIVMCQGHPIMILLLAGVGVAFDALAGFTVATVAHTNGITALIPRRNSAADFM